MFQSINDVASALSFGVFVTSARLIVLVVAGLIVTTFARRLSASVRHHVWLAVLVAIISLPLLSACLPSLALLPSDNPFAMLLANQGSGTDHAQMDKAAIPNARLLEEYAYGTESENDSLLPAASPRIAETLAQNALIESEASGPSAAALAVAVWLTVACFVICRPICGQLKLRRLLRNASPGEPSLQHLHESLRTQLGIQRTVTLQIAREEIVPMTYGVFRPAVVLPASARSWTPDRLRMVLLHELTHVQRWDCATQWVCTLASAVYWFHPGIWFVAHRLHAEREAVCDDAVLNAGHLGSRYATELLDVSTGCRRDVLAMCAGIAMSRSSRIEHRMKSILNSELDREPINWPSAVAITTLVIAVGATVAAIAPVAADVTSPLLNQAEDAASDQRDRAGETTAKTAVVLEGRPDTLVLDGIVNQAASDDHLERTAWITSRGADKRTLRLRNGEAFSLGGLSAVIVGIEERAVLLKTGDVVVRWQLGTSLKKSFESLAALTDPKKLDGQWWMLATQLDADSESFDTGEMSVVIKDGKFIIQSASEPSRSTTRGFELGSTDHIDFVSDEDGSSKKVLGTYRMVGDNLWIAVNDDTESVNPIPPKEALSQVPLRGVRYMWLQKSAPTVDIASEANDPKPKPQRPGLLGRIYSVNRDGSDLKLLADDSLLDGYTFLGASDWSHDGKWIACGATPYPGRSYAKSHVVKFCVEGPNKGEKLDLGCGLSPSWSPDNKQIAFFINGKNPIEAQAGLWVMDADGNNRRRLGYAVHPQWSPDGKSILAVSGHKLPRKFLLFDVATGKRKEIVKNYTGIGLPTWSPDSKRFATTVRKDGNRTLGIFDVAESPEMFDELWSDGQWDAGFDETWPDWSPDGKTIAYTPNGSFIWLVSADKNDERPKKLNVTLGSSEVLFVAWGPDNKRLSFTLVSGDPTDFEPPIAKQED